MDTNPLTKGNESLKIRHVISTSGRLPQNPAAEPVSGVVGAALGLAKPQIQMGHSVAVWGWNDKHPPGRAQWNGVELWTSPEWDWARFARWDLSWLAPVWCHGVTEAQVDILHTYVDPNLLYIPGARIRLLHLQTLMPNPFPSAYKRLLERADAVICCSGFIRDQFLAASCYTAERTFVIHNSADLNAYQTADGQAVRAQWGLNDRDFVILYSGALVPEKGIVHLIRALADLQPLIPNAVLLIVGSAQLWTMPGGHPIGDQYEAELRKLAEGLNVRFVGNLPRGRMPAAYSAADVLVVPSVWDEPLGTVVCEAMAAGRAVIGSRVGGITETVADGQTGFLVSPGDVAQLSRAIQTLALNTSLRQQMGQAALERAEKFSWEVSAQRLDKIYYKLLARSDGHKPLGHSRTTN